MSTQYRIGKVCDVLRSEFPDVSISKLRFLEEQGLVEPDRTQGGYRIYTQRHIDELRQVLHMQRDEFLPLKVIKEELARRMSSGGTSRGGRGGQQPPRVSISAPDERVALDDLCRRAQVTPEFVAECREADLVSGIVDEDGRTFFSLHECGIVQAAGQMRRLGVDVRHLRGVRTAMGRSAALVEQYAAARLRVKNPEQRELAVRSVESLTQSLADFMRLAFVRDVRLMTARSFAAAGATTPARQHDHVVRN
ncbi:MAG: MerR family transcriptional regulator [Thermoleophilia bacterium]|nr:MerR family transcriptional regulator [Thermoleophilia bacterium]